MNPVIKELEGKTLGVNVPNSWIARAAAEIRRLEAELVALRLDALRLERDKLKMAEKRNAELLAAIADHVTARGEYMRQRDVLLEALEAMLNAEPGYEWGGYSAEEIKATEKACAAIASVKGAAS